MFWNKKKKKEDVTDAADPQAKEEAAEEEAEDIGPDAEDLEEFGYGEDEETEETPSEESTGDGEEDEPDEDDASPVTVKCNSVDMLAEFVGNRGTGALQFIKKDTLELIELKEVHLRIAEVWGSVSMAREYPDDEYARIMLAIELQKSPDDYFILPEMTDKEIKSAVDGFLNENFFDGGKKYSRSPEKFRKFLKENDKTEEWKEYMKSFLYDKMTEFCDSNGIVFNEEEVSEADGKDE